MTDWRETGRDLAAWWLDMHRRGLAGRDERLARQREQIDELDPVGAAARQYYRGDRTALPTLLRHRSLSMDDQERLAQFLEGDLEPPKPQRGRPKSNERAAAGIAERFYRDWKELNGRLGVKDRGESDRMKDEAVRFVTEDFLSHRYRLDPARVREFLERSNDRRN